jgi:hypothetical protein
MPGSSGGARVVPMEWRHVDAGWAEASIVLPLTRVDLPADVFLYEASSVDLTSADSVWRLSEALACNVVPHDGSRFSDMGCTRWTEYVELVTPYAERLGLSFTPADAEARIMDAGQVHVAEVAARGAVLQRLGQLVTVQMTVDVDDEPALERLLETFAPGLEFASAALTRYAPRFVLSTEGGSTFGVDRMESGYQAAVLQALSRVVGSTEPKFCARQGCGRAFYAQRGRAAFSERESHRRSDAIYCSANCAKRAATQEYRKRQRAAKGEGS